MKMGKGNKRTPISLSDYMSQGAFDQVVGEGDQIDDVKNEGAWEVIPVKLDSGACD